MFIYQLGFFSPVLAFFQTWFGFFSRYIWQPCFSPKLRIHLKKCGWKWKSRDTCFLLASEVCGLCFFLTPHLILFGKF